MKICLPILLASIGTSGVYSQTLSENKQQIVALAKSHSDSSIGYLKKVVTINSGTRNLQGGREVVGISAKSLPLHGRFGSWIHPLCEGGEGGSGWTFTLECTIDTFTPVTSPFIGVNLLTKLCSVV